MTTDYRVPLDVPQAAYDLCGEPAKNQPHRDPSLLLAQLLSDLGIKITTTA